MRIVVDLVAGAFRFDVDEREASFFDGKWGLIDEVRSRYAFVAEVPHPSRPPNPPNVLDGVRLAHEVRAIVGPGLTAVTVEELLPGAPGTHTHSTRTHGLLFDVVQ